MKRVLLIVLLLLSSLKNVEAYKNRIRSMGIYETNAGQVFSIGVPFVYPPPMKERDSYDLDIHMSYNSYYSKAENVSFDVIINAPQISGFKQDLLAIKNKCEEWGAVAKKNGISFYTKELPLTVRFSRMTCFDFASPSEQEVVCSFIYSNGIPKCELHFIQRKKDGYELMACSAYIILEMDELADLVEDINPVLENIRKHDLERGKTDNLFK